MGNTPAKQNNWDNIQTDAISSTIPYMKGMSKDAKILSLKLGNLLNSESEVEQNQPENVFMSKYANILQSEELDSDNVSGNDEQLSATSPFITSDMYNAILKNQNNQTSEVNLQGGANLEGGSIHKSSSTSSTSDIDKNIKKMSSDDNIKTANSQISTDESMSGGEFDYISSSAHTSGDASSDEHKSEKKVESTEVNSDVEKTDSPTEEDTDESIVNKVIESSSENVSTIANNETVEKDSAVSSSSIKTEDINMISVSE